MTRPIPHRVGVYLAVVQLLFTTTWTVYVIYLPALAAQVGIAKEDVPYILVLDQAIFVCTDLAMGIAADRVSRALGRLGPFVLGATLLSCAAFFVLPRVTAGGAAWPFLALAIVWSASSSALRAPPLVLLGKYAAKPAQPWLAGLSLLGLGVANAIAPLATVALRDVDPRAPFAAASVALALATGGIVWAERHLARQAPAPADAPRARAGTAGPWFFAGVALLGLGLQIHFAVNSAPLYLRFAPAAELPHLMPVFWIGFSLLMLPATWAVRRVGGLAVMGAGALVGAVATRLAAEAGGLPAEVGAQLLCGGAWGCVAMSAVAAALTVGRPGREGALTGALFAGLALAAGTRIVLVAAKLPQNPLVAPILTWTPLVAWAVGGVAFLVAAWRARTVKTPA